MAIDPAIPSDIYNLGTNVGNSNLAVVQLASTITGTDIPVLHGPKREGDPATLTADAGKFMAVSSWRPQFTLEDMIRHAWAWYNR
jgi:UDP-glucose 4-epimerase